MFDDIPHVQPGRTIRHRCPQQACAGHRGQSLAITADDDGRGLTWICHRCGWRGGQRDHHHVAERFLPRAETASTRWDTLSFGGRRLWASCRRISDDSVASAYLRARGCALPHPEGDLRWHPALRHPSGHVGPALVALVTDVHDPERCLTLHRTWISGDSTGQKANVDPPRLLLAGHPKAGGVIRLWPDHEVTCGLGVAEGVETALTLARALRPVWAAIDAGNLASLPYLYPIEALTVAADHDAAGLRAFDEAAATWLKGAARRGLDCEVRKVLAPHHGHDLADWVVTDAA